MYCVSAEAFLRPETAQGAFVAFKRVLATCRKKLPFGATGTACALPAGAFSSVCTLPDRPPISMRPHALAVLFVRAGVGQMGRAFRNEISPGQFLFRTREFEQLELQYFTLPEEAAEQCVQSTRVPLTKTPSL